MACRITLGCVALACAVACARSPSDDQSGGGADGVPAAATTPAPRAPPSTSVRIAPTRLLTMRGSAYGATLGSSDGTGFLLTSGAAYRFVQGEAPTRWAGDFGVAPALTPGHISFWSGGAFRRVPTSGGEPALVATVPRQPQRFVTSGDHIAWLERADGGFSIHTLDGSKGRLVYAAAGYVGTLAMDDDRIYFAERAADRSWRLGLVARSGGAAHYTKPKRGRLPALLVLAESLFYYDGPSSSVRRVSPDLGSEEVIARDVICSPIAVADNVYCAQPAGLVEIRIDGGVRRTIPLDTPGAITAIAATAQQLTWVTDIGGDQLAVDSIPLTDKPSLAP
ncbi:MAG TPA: hypothetical protein VI197_12015 [Polyangiaceae bacterium]